MLPERLNSYLLALNEDADAIFRQAPSLPHPIAVRNHFLLLVGCSDERTTVRFLELAPGTEPVLAVVALEVMPDEVVVVVVRVAATADEGTIVALELAADRALMRF